MQNALTITTLFRAIGSAIPVEVTIYVAYQKQNDIGMRQALRIFADDTSGTLWARGASGPKWSLRDAGIIPNDYNKTKSFLYKHDAVAYLREFCTCQCTCCSNRNSRWRDMRWSNGS